MRTLTVRAEPRTLTIDPYPQDTLGTRPAGYGLGLYGLDPYGDRWTVLLGVTVRPEPRTLTIPAHVRTLTIAAQDRTEVVG